MDGLLLGRERDTIVKFSSGASVSIGATAYGVGRERFDRTAPTLQPCLTTRHESAKLYLYNHKPLNLDKIFPRNEPINILHLGFKRLSRRPPFESLVTIMEEEKNQGTFSSFSSNNNKSKKMILQSISCELLRDVSRRSVVSILWMI